MKQNIIRTIAWLSAFTILLSTMACQRKSNDAQNKNKSIDTSEYLMQLEMVDALARSNEPVWSDIDPKRILSIADSIQECGNENDDWQSLYNTIIENSQTNPEGDSIFQSYSFKDGEKNVFIDGKIFKNALRNALSILKANAIGDEKEDICTLQSLKFFFKNDLNSYFIADYDPENNSIYLNLCSCQKAFEATLRNRNEGPWNTQEFMTKIILFTLNRVRHIPCQCRIEKGQKNIFLGDEEIKSLVFLERAACESEIMSADNFKKSYINNDYFMPFERDYESMILFMAAFKENRYPCDYYEAIDDTDLKKLHAFFGLQSESDIYEFYRITSILNSASGYSDLERPVEEADAYMSIMRIALNDLIIGISESDLSIHDSLYLFDTLKSYFADYSQLLTPTYDYDVSPKLIDAIFEYERIFNDFLCTYFDLSEKKLDDYKNGKLSWKESTAILNGESLVDYQKIEQKFPLLELIMQNYHFVPYRNSVWFDEEYSKIQGERTKRISFVPKVEILENDTI